MDPMHLDEEKTLEEVDSVTNMAGNGRITYSSIGNIRRIFERSIFQALEFFL